MKLRWGRDATATVIITVMVLMGVQAFRAVGQPAVVDFAVWPESVQLEPGQQAQFYAATLYEDGTAECDMAVASEDPAVFYNKLDHPDACDWAMSLLVGPTGSMGVSEVGGLLIWLWDASVSPDVEFYRIYFGLGSGMYDEGMYETNAETTEYLQDWGKPSQRYYGVVTAFDSAGNESEPSNEATAVFPAQEAPPFLRFAWNAQPDSVVVAYDSVHYRVLVRNVSLGTNYVLDSLRVHPDTTFDWHSGVGDATYWVAVYVQGFGRDSVFATAPSDSTIFGYPHPDSLYGPLPPLPTLLRPSPVRVDTVSGGG